MMHITICAVGKWGACPEKELFELYAKRLPWTLSLKEIAASSPEKEAPKLLEACAKTERIVALDATGKTLSSEELATQLARWQDEGIKDVGFVIGGHAGLDTSIKTNANLLVSFGRVTWPHMLMRPLLAEQIYRAHSIMTGHPYHRGILSRTS